MIDSHRFSPLETKQSVETNQLALRMSQLNNGLFLRKAFVAQAIRVTSTRRPKLLDLDSSYLITRNTK